MKAFLLVLLWAGVSWSARAQAYYLDLTGQPLDLPYRNIAVEQVLDGREGHPAIGMVYRTLANKPAAVLFRHGMEADLTAYLKTQIPARPTDQLIVLCLRQLRVSETLNYMGEQATADLAADMYLHRPDGYHFVQATGFRMSARALETTHLHARHVAKMLEECLGQLRTADWVAAAARPPLALAALVGDVPVNQALGGRHAAAPAILREVPRRGIYQSFEQFLANRPDTSLVIRLDTVRLRYKSQYSTIKWGGVAHVRPFAANGTGQRVVVTDAWGFSDGQQLYILHNKRFFPLMRQGNAFTFVGEAPTDLVYAQEAARTQARAGLIGVAMMRMPDHTAEPLAYALDMRTGGLTPYPGLGVAVRPDTAFIYVYRPVQATGPAAIKVYVDGKERGTLRPGQYLELPWWHFGKTMQLCLGSEAMVWQCQYLVPNTTKLNYLRIAPASAAPWQWMPPTKGAADLDELDRQAR